MRCPATPKQILIVRALQHAYKTNNISADLLKRRANLVNQFKEEFGALPTIKDLTYVGVT